jgi:isopentenyl-diphosphate delta-isomerase
LDQVRLIHEALPDIDFSEVSLETDVFGIPVSAPVFVSSMTAGHEQGREINLRLAQACESQGWMMGVGSQRRELSDSTAAEEWKLIRRQVPNAIFFGNIGITQLITSTTDQIQKLIDGLEAEGLFVHTNPLQECLQPEGTPQFRGALKALEELCGALQVPVVLKEVGCGFSGVTLARLKDTGLAAVDVSGLGGTHWGRIEMQRNPQASQFDFADWGISTIESLLTAKQLDLPYEVWASGGVRSGQDVVKLVAMGAKMIGMAKPLLEKAIEEINTRESRLVPWMQNLENEMKISLFCTGCESVEKIQMRKAWSWK